MIKTSRGFKAAILLLALLFGGFELHINRDLFGYHPTNQHIQDIFNKLKRMSGQILPISLTISDANVINAYATANPDAQVTIFRGLIDRMHNDSELSLVLAHELAHIINWDVYGAGPRDDNTIRTMELRADKYGAFLMMKAGYDICKGRLVFKMMADLYGDDPNMDHPAFVYRVDQLNVNCGGD